LSFSEGSPIIAGGWLRGARRRLSPNADSRPPDTQVSLLVIHNISLPPGEFGGDYVEQLFLNCLDCTMQPGFEGLRGLRVSAHLFIDRAGGITQFVPFDRRAWHAGVSSFAGRDRCNDFSIGIELEGADQVAYTAFQYTALARITRALRGVYPALAGDANIVGHSDISPERKTDPGPAFDWVRYRRLISSGSPDPDDPQGEC
jgi:AmpD protein